TWVAGEAGRLRSAAPCRTVAGHAATTLRAMPVESKLPRVGTTIFTVMSQLAAEHRAVNLGQGFPDFPVPDFLVEALHRAMREGHNQYAPMTGIPALRDQIANKVRGLYGRAIDPATDVTVTSGATEAI